MTMAVGGAPRPMPGGEEAADDDRDGTAAHEPRAGGRVLLQDEARLARGSEAVARDDREPRLLEARPRLGQRRHRLGRHECRPSKGERTEGNTGLR